MTTAHLMLDKQVKPSLEMWCICDPNGDLVHTTVGTTADVSIQEWLDTEISINWLANVCRSAKGKETHCAQSWEGFESQGYSVVKVDLIPKQLHSD